MFRYIALFWDRSDPEAVSHIHRLHRGMVARVPEWRCVLDVLGSRVYCADERSYGNGAYTLDINSGVILGQLFSKSSWKSDSRELTSSEVFRAIEAGGISVLTKQYWGRYIAVVSQHDRDIFHILRDPCGGLACFRIVTRTAIIFFSSAEDWDLFGLSEPSINWHYMQAYVCSLDLRSSETGLVGVTSVQPGECITIIKGRVERTQQLWDPLEIACAATITRVADAVAQVKCVTEQCTWAWTGVHSSILHLLSGGLDSSVVLHCIRTCPTNPLVTCLNYFGTSSQEEDERLFARLAAGKTRTELIELEAQLPAVDLREALAALRHPRPQPYPYQLAHSKIEYNLAQQRGASALFHGTGGDQIFFQHPIELSAIDFVLHKGLNSESMRHALNVSQMTGDSIWKTCLEVLRQRIAMPSKHLEIDPECRKTLVPKNVYAAARNGGMLAGRKRRKTKDQLPGKLRHISMMSTSSEYYNSFAVPNDPERVYPLMSQPLKELCLKIPTYVLTEGGWDRSVERQAFQRELPESIILRRMKGGIDQGIRKMLFNNLNFVRELLLDGILVERNLLDRRMLEEALKPTRLNIGLAAGEIFGDHFNTEVWLRTWTRG